jgi:hypothetical protein
MAFSRRIGELWEPFVTTCFDYPIRKDVTLFIPPLFEEIRRRLTNEVRDFIQRLNISRDDKEQLLRYYDQVWHWEVYCGAETYPKVLEYSGFDLGVWMHENVTWMDDVSLQFLNSLERNDLVKYLTW